MAEIILNVNNNVVNLVGTVADGNIPVDGTAVTVDGVAVANNQVIYTPNNTNVTERAFWDTGADHTQPWTKIATTQMNALSQKVTVSIKALQGVQYGNQVLVIKDVATGAVVSEPTSPTVFGNSTNGGYQNTVGIFKYATSSTISLVAPGEVRDTVITFTTAPGSVPFTDTSKMQVTGISLINASPGSFFAAMVDPIANVTDVTITVTNIGSVPSDVVVVVQVSQIG